VHKELLKLFRDLFKLEGVQVNDVIAKCIYGIIEKLLFVSEGHLLSREFKPNYGDMDYSSTALDSLYGATLSSLIKYAISQHKNKKDITLILDKLLDKSEYEETRTVIGKYLVDLYSIYPGWTELNINKILPENDSAKFNAAWTTFIIFSCIDMFDLLKPKYEYALKNKLGVNSEKYMKFLGKYLLQYYYLVSGKISLDDNMMELIFDIPGLLQSGVISIGEHLEKEEHIPIQIIDRLKSLWDYIIFKLNVNNESKYYEALKGFQLWYGYGYKIPQEKRKWLLDGIHDLVVNRCIDMAYIFDDNTKKALLEDLPKSARKVFEIVREHSKMVEKSKGMLHDYGIEVMKEVFSYIKNTHLKMIMFLKMKKIGLLMK
jgi:hypothetical protein